MTGSWDRTIRVWKGLQECVQVIEAPSWVLALDRVDDETFVSCHNDLSVWLWTLNNSREWSKSKELQGHTESVTVLATLSDGKLVASGGEGKNVLVHEVESGRLLWELGHEHNVSALVPLPGIGLVTGSWDGAVRVWNLTGPRPKSSVLHGHATRVYAAAVHDNGRLVTGDMRGTIIVWAFNGKKWASVGEKLRYHRAVEGLTPLSGNRIFVATGNARCALWDLSRYEEAPASSSLSNFTCLALLSDRKPVTGGTSGEVVIWKTVERGQPAKIERVVVGRNKHEVKGVVAVKGGFAWWNSGYQGGFHLWRNDTEVPYPTPLGLFDGGALNAAKGIDDGRTVVGVGRKGVYVWSLEEMRLLHTIPSEHNEHVDVYDTDRVVVGGWSGKISLVNIRTGAVEAEVSNGPYNIQVLCTIAEGVVVGGSGVSLFKVSMGNKQVERLTELSPWTPFAALGDWKVLGLRGGQVEIWDSRDPPPMGPFFPPCPGELLVLDNVPLEVVMGHDAGKFYLLRAWVHDGRYFFYARWGRVNGAWAGQHLERSFDSEIAAVDQFLRKFEAKTGNRWDEFTRGDFTQVQSKYRVHYSGGNYPQPTEGGLRTVLGGLDGGKLVFGDRRAGLSVMYWEGSSNWVAYEV